MGDQDQRAAELAQLSAEPFDAGDVQVVARLVQQQDIGIADQRPRQRGAAAPAAGERGQGGVAVEIECAQRALHALLHRPAVHGFEGVLHFFQFGEIGVGRRRQLGVALQQGARLGEPAGDVGQHAALVGPGQGLLQKRQAGARAHPAFTAVRGQVAGEHAQQGAFAGPVAPQQTDALSAFNAQIDLVEQHLLAVLKMDLIEA